MKEDGISKLSADLIQVVIVWRDVRDTFFCIGVSREGEIRAHLAHELVMIRERCDEEVKVKGD
jgi:hypothetical protein